MERGSVVIVSWSVSSELHARLIDGLGAYCPPTTSSSGNRRGCFGELEARGTRSPLVRENTSAALLADLHTFLIKTALAWLGAVACILRATSASTGPAFVASAALHRRIDVTFKDISIASTWIQERFSVHYKTGGTSSCGGINDDPLMAGSTSSWRSIAARAGLNPDLLEDD
jgi:hypothetical protein